MPFINGPVRDVYVLRPVGQNKSVQGLSGNSSASKGKVGAVLVLFPLDGSAKGQIGQERKCRVTLPGPTVLPGSKAARDLMLCCILANEPCCRRQGIVASGLQQGFCSWHVFRALCIWHKGLPGHAFH